MNETYDFNVSLLVSCFIFQNTEGALSRSLSVFESLPQCFCFSPSVFLVWNIETKNETLKLYVSAVESVEYQRIET